jgi:hypothetical protein
LNLAKLRNRAPEAPDVQLEFRALQAERLVEREAAKERYGAEDVTFRVTMLEYKRLLTTKPLLHRLMLGAGAQALQQWTGINGEPPYPSFVHQTVMFTDNSSHHLLRPNCIWTNWSGRRYYRFAGYRCRRNRQLPLHHPRRPLCRQRESRLWPTCVEGIYSCDQFGRKPMLAGGEALMAICHATIAAIIAVYDGRFDQGYKAAGNGAVFMSTYIQS